MKDELLPAGATIEELEAKARDCEERAKHEREPFASALLQEARRYREWATQLRSGRWLA